jgi:hypothetical protein
LGGTAGGTFSCLEASAISVVGPDFGSAKNIGQYAGLYIAASAPTTISSNTGVRIGLQSGSGTNRGLWFSSNSTGPGSGICWGDPNDTYIWRGIGGGQLVTPGDWMSRRYRCSSAPTVAAGPGAGTSPPTLTITGSDAGFTVTLIEGTPSATGVIFTVTLGAGSTGSPPRVGLSPKNAATAALGGTSSVYVVSSNTTVTLNSGSAALTAGTTYAWDFVCNFA